LISSHSTAASLPCTLSLHDALPIFNLQGHTSASPVRPLQALAGLLRALGVRADAVPVDLEEAATLYRSLLAGRRMLVVLDNEHPDRKSTRLNSSHRTTSYAVFCLKK